jgi:hypothetical protein
MLIVLTVLSPLLCIESALAQVQHTNEWSSRSTPWTYSSSTKPSIDLSANSPSGGGALKFTYAAGTYPTSTNGGTAEYSGLSGGSGTEYYFGHWVKWSPGFTWNAVGNKIDYIWTRDKTPSLSSYAYIATRTNNGGWNLFVDVGIDTPHARSCNRTIPTFATGRWYWFEIHVKMNTVGSRNGVIEVWVDDVQCMTYTDVKMVEIQTTWGYFLHSPIWGGGGGTIPATQYLWVDHTVISRSRIGRPGASAASDTTPPSTPTNIQAR